MLKLTERKVQPPKWKWIGALMEHPEHAAEAQSWQTFKKSYFPNRFRHQQLKLSFRH